MKQVIIAVAVVFLFGSLWISCSDRASNTANWSDSSAVGGNPILLNSPTHRVVILALGQTIKLRHSCDNEFVYFTTPITALDISVSGRLGVSINPNGRKITINFPCTWRETLCQSSSPTNLWVMAEINTDTSTTYSDNGCNSGYTHRWQHGRLTGYQTNPTSDDMYSSIAWVWNPYDYDVMENCFNFISQSPSTVADDCSF